LLEVQRAVDAPPTSVFTAPPDTEPALILAAQNTIYLKEIEAALIKAHSALKIAGKYAMDDLKKATPAAVAPTTTVVEPMINAPIPTHTTPTEAQTETPTAIASIYKSPKGTKYHYSPYCGNSGQMPIAINAPTEFAAGDKSLCERCYSRRVAGTATAI